MRRRLARAKLHSWGLRAAAQNGVVVYFYVDTAVGHPVLHTRIKEIGVFYNDIDSEICRNSFDQLEI